MKYSFFVATRLVIKENKKRQKDRKTERQKDRKTKIQLNIFFQSKTLNFKKFEVVIDYELKFLCCSSFKNEKNEMYITTKQMSKTQIKSIFQSKS